jgi:hypothetical protein
LASNTRSIKAQGKKSRSFKRKKTNTKHKASKKATITPHHNTFDTVESERLWPEEEQALEDIEAGKTKLVHYSGEEYLKHLGSMING